MRSLFLFLLYVIVSTSTWALKFGLPIDCDVGKKCPVLIQNYVDTGCKEASYKSHKGTDFRLIYYSDTTDGGGVNVLASAPGKVIGVRNDMKDLFPPLPKDFGGKDCGNGVRIDHGNGWTSQYCHMLKGSVVVKTGDVVEERQLLGKVGYSGRAAFPHVHITIEENKEVMSPFWGAPVGKFACEDKQSPLWNVQALKEIAANENRVFLGGGAAAGAANYGKAQKGDYKNLVLKADSPALVAWVFTMNRAKGDQDQVVIKKPDGKILVNSTTKTLSRHKATYFSFTGKPRKGDLWPVGTYQVVWNGIRGGKVFDTETFKILVSK
ncbi:MAG: M23 family metallopeptidase [bacterium]|nr:M23 family metallopeptidase [bacterium]